MQEGFHLRSSQENPVSKHSSGVRSATRKKWSLERKYLAPNIALLAVEIIFGTIGKLPEIRTFGTSGMPLGILLCLTQVALLLATVHRFDRGSRCEEKAW